ncbi:hypothetical protein LWC34_03620 [Kibdelosporangium philippinense]|uniref:Uncharacterized protein n=1 Tax=Kibdelosporangium philippinense TaxID=211113 RepID=A0ABS8Z1V9_9PSEU|nr:hypothetical protein [Kibdelosporangium philippinense]MCE7001928.1 hypothetical protein [Kibdelosporangium philippinense]
MPTVDGARIPVNNPAMPPCRTRSRSLIESAPAAIPATIVLIFAPAFAPTEPPSRTSSPARSDNPASSASRITGTSPACDTNPGSSNLTDTAPRVCDAFTQQMPSHSDRYVSLVRTIVPSQRASARPRHDQPTKIFGESRF